jgi:hypothetical protein
VHSRKKVVGYFLGWIPSRKNLKEWIYLFGKIGRFNWRLGLDAEREQHHCAFIRLPANWHAIFPLLRNVWYTGQSWGETLGEEP